MTFVQQGAYPDGTFTSNFGFLGQDQSAVIRIVVLDAAGGTPTADEAALVHEIQCSAEFAGLRLAC